MTNLTQTIEAMPPAERKGALTVLDDLSRPLTVREIEKALRLHGVTRSRSVLIAASVKKLHIIALIGAEHEAA